MNQKIFNCPHCGKIIPEYILKGESTRKAVTCPECGSKRNWKDGMRQTSIGKVQRYLCRNCCHRFSYGC